MGRKGPRAKTKIVLKSVNQWEQLGNMHNWKFQTFLNKNHPNAGISAPSWKIRYGNHTHSFRHSGKRVNTSLAGYIWRLKDQGRDYSLSWRQLAILPTFNPTTNSCRLCLVEKYTIMHQPELATINQNDEFYTACRHKEAKLLDKT